MQSEITSCETWPTIKQLGGARGRALTTDLPELGLRASDRLEPSPTLPDIGSLEHETAPIDVVFWRRSEESLVRNRNSFWKASIGINAANHLTVDVLHCLHLGVMNRWCRMAFWTIFTSGALGSVGSSEHGLVACCLALRASMEAWHTKRHKDFPDEELTKLSDLVPAMFGKEGTPKCKTKGAETWTCLLFLIHECERLKGRLGPDWQRVRCGGQALEEMVLIWRAQGWSMTRAAIQDKQRREQQQ